MSSSSGICGVAYPSRGLRETTSIYSCFGKQNSSGVCVSDHEGIDIPMPRTPNKVSAVTFHMKTSSLRSPLITLSMHASSISLQAARPLGRRRKSSANLRPKHPGAQWVRGYSSLSRSSAGPHLRSSCPSHPMDRGIDCKWLQGPFSFLAPLDACLFWTVAHRRTGTQAGRLFGAEASDRQRGRSRWWPGPAGRPGT